MALEGETDQFPRPPHAFTDDEGREIEVRRLDDEVDALLECMFGYGQQHGVDRVWLSVERHNTVALRLYESLGFEQLSGRSEFKMEREL